MVAVKCGSASTLDPLIPCGGILCTLHHVPCTPHPGRRCYVFGLGLYIGAGVSEGGEVFCSPSRWRWTCDMRLLDP